MITSRDSILNKINANIRERFEKPDMQMTPQRFPDKIAKFMQTLQEVGGNAVIVEKGENISHVIQRLYPTANRIASNLNGLDCITYNPDDADCPNDLNNTDLAIIKGEFGVAENSAVWIKQQVKYKAIYFISEALVILLDRNQLYDTMQDAYKRKDFNNFAYGCFMSGPSKTADIEQSLVKGAQASQQLTVLLTNETD